ncbi:MAG: sortase [bacterium]|nr:sortase [bacterium]
MFGHTSTEYWKKNPYGTVLKNLPKIQEGEIIKVVWDGKLYSYKVKGHKIVYPRHVNDMYMKYENKGKDYITLMGCYPIGKSTKRYMLFAEEVPNS